jgi:hypothetical protein
MAINRDHLNHGTKKAPKPAPVLSATMFTRDELQGYLDIVTSLHDPKVAKAIVAKWAHGKHFDKPAKALLLRYLFNM